MFNQYENLIIPVEVKSAAAVSLHFLHPFMDLAPHRYAVRIYAGKLDINEIKTLGRKTSAPMNLLFYSAGSIAEYLEWMISQ